MHAYLSVDIRTRACFALSGLNVLDSAAVTVSPRSSWRRLSAHTAALPQGVHFDFQVGDEDHIEWSSM